MIQVREKIAYGLGDTASNLIFQTLMLFLTFFYTDIFGLDPALVGTLFLAIRLLDAITDPLMGWLADRSHSRFGRFRPYLLYVAPIFALLSYLTFTTPDLSETNKVIYAFVTYALLMITYTAINIPYCALGAVLTDDPKQRVSIQSYRFVCAMLGGLIVSAGTLPLVDWFGEGDLALGYQQTMLMMGIIGMLLFFACFAGTKERVIPPVEPYSFQKSLRLLWQNDQFRILCLAVTLLLFGLVMRSTLAIYYVKYYLQQPELTTGFITLGMIGNLIGCALAQPLSQRVCKVKLYRNLQWLCAAICLASFFLAPDQLILAFLSYFFWNLCSNMGSPLLWAKMTDTIDYGHLKTGSRLTGILYSSIIFFIKLGLALGGAVAAWLLAFYDYQADQIQSQATLDGLLLSFYVYPALAAMAVAGVMKFYQLNQTTVSAIHQQLTQLKQL